MRDSLQSVLKLALHGVIWVFVLSIRIEGRTLFSHAHGILVNNPVVAAIETQVSKGIRAAFDMASGQARRLLGDNGGRRA
jgi:hypothetical protein